MHLAQGISVHCKAPCSVSGVKHWLFNASKRLFVFKSQPWLFRPRKLCEMHWPLRNWWQVRSWTCAVIMSPPDYSRGIAHVRLTLDELRERKLRTDELSDVRRIKLQQLLQLQQSERDAEQVSITVWTLHLVWGRLADIFTNILLTKVERWMLKAKTVLCAWKLFKRFQLLFSIFKKNLGRGTGNKLSAPFARLCVSSRRVQRSVSRFLTRFIIFEDKRNGLAMLNEH